MNWQDFFKLKVAKSGETFFAATLALPQEFAMHELIMSRFDHLQLSTNEKKKLSIGLRKILVCHNVFKTKEFRDVCRDFRTKIDQSPDKEFVFSTEGGGVYLFLQLLKEASFTDKKIICYTSELPLPIMRLKPHPHIQFIYRPHGISYLADFSSLWKESELMSLFELKDFKASA